MPNNYLSVLYKHIIQVENKNVGLKVGGAQTYHCPTKNVGGAHVPLAPPPASYSIPPGPLVRAARDSVLLYDVSVRGLIRSSSTAVSSALSAHFLAFSLSGSVSFVTAISTSSISLCMIVSAISFSDATMSMRM